MIRIAALTALTSLLASYNIFAAVEPLRGADDPSPPHTSNRLPLHIADCHQEGLHFEAADRPPMLMVGSLTPRQGSFTRAEATERGKIVEACPCRGNRGDPFIVKYLIGDLKPRPPREDRDTFVFVRSPMMNSGDEFTIDSLKFEKDTFTLMISSWHDNGERDKNIPWSRTLAVRLGPLADGHLTPGDYKLRLIFRDMFIDYGISSKFKANGFKHHWTRFTVAPANEPQPWDAPQSPYIIRESDLVSGQTASALNEDREPLWQLPRYYVKEHPRPFGGLQPSNITIGAADIAGWLKTAEGDRDVFCKLSPTGDAETLHVRIMGPSLNDGESAEISGIVWFGDVFDETPRVVIYGEVYRRGEQAKRETKVPRLPELVVPLDLRGKGLQTQKGIAAKLAKALKPDETLKVEWHEHQVGQ